VRDKIILTNKIKPLFWEYDPEEIDLEKDQRLVIKRVLSNGSVEDLRWLREAFGDEEQQRNLANLAKILLAIRDTDVDKLSPLIPEVEVIEADHFMKSAISSEKIIGGESLNVSKKKLFNFGHC